MDRRRSWWLAAVVAGGVVLLILGRPGADPARESTSDPPPPPPPAGAPRVDPPPPAPDRPADSAPPPAGSPPAPSPHIPHDHSGVAGAETLPPAAAAAAITAADEFAAGWVDPAPGWYERLTPLSTPALLAALAGADPPQPAPQVDGGARVLFEAPSWARVGVPTHRGTLVLDLVEQDDRWLVAAIDWRPTR